MDDASLDDFLDVGEDGNVDDGDGEGDAMANGDGDGGSDDGDAASTSTGDREATDDEWPAVDPSAVDPATATATWSPAGAVCESCGARAKRRWQGEAGPVCPDCKRW